MAPPRDNTSLRLAQEATLARLAAISAQFEGAKGSGRMAGKVGVVTGVGSLKGIGRSTARLFAREGAKHLYVLDYDGSTLPQLKEEIEGKFPGVKVTTITGDAASPALVASLCERVIKEEDRLDFFFANAGISGAGFKVDLIESEDWMEMMRINSLSCFLAIKHASVAMQHSSSCKKAGEGGSIILTASVAGMRSGAGPIDYSASKAAVINLAQTSAQSLAGTNIRVNALLPGLIETGMTEYTFGRARERGTLGKVGQLNPTRRFGIAEEIAQAVLFLASDEASYVNGIALPVDGGLSSSHPIIVGQSF